MQKKKEYIFKALFSLHNERFNSQRLGTECSQNSARSDHENRPSATE